MTIYIIYYIYKYPWLRENLQESLVYFIFMGKSMLSGQDVPLNPIYSQDVFFNLETGDITIYV